MVRNGQYDTESRSSQSSFIENNNAVTQNEIDILSQFSQSVKDFENAKSWRTIKAPDAFVEKHISEVREALETESETSIEQKFQVFLFHLRQLMEQENYHEVTLFHTFLNFLIKNLFKLKIYLKIYLN